MRRVFQTQVVGFMAEDKEQIQYGPIPVRHQRTAEIAKLGDGQFLTEPDPRMLERGRYHLATRTDSNNSVDTGLFEVEPGLHGKNQINWLKRPGGIFKPADVIPLRQDEQAPAAAFG